MARKFTELANQEVFVGDERIAKVKDVIIDTDEWKITHLVIELTKEASEDILGATPALTRSALNTLAISALEKGAACCTTKGVEIKVSKKQLHIYLRPA
jgi:sporulation protein YlmC with PRC-barrel domain